MEISEDRSSPSLPSGDLLTILIWASWLMMMTIIMMIVMMVMWWWWKMTELTLAPFSSSPSVLASLSSSSSSLECLLDDRDALRGDSSSSLYFPRTPSPLFSSWSSLTSNVFSFWSWNKRYWQICLCICICHLCTDSLVLAQSWVFSFELLALLN